MFFVFTKPMTALESHTITTNVIERRLSGPESVYRAYHPFTQRHSAEEVKKSRPAHTLCSRFADVLSLECSHSRCLPRPVKFDHGLMCNTRSLVLSSSGQTPVTSTLVATAVGHGPLHTNVSSAQSVLSSSSLRQFSFTADDDRDPLVVSGSRCSSSMNVDAPQLSPLWSRRTPGDFPSNLLLAPISAAGKQSPRNITNQQGVS